MSDRCEAFQCYECGVLTTRLIWKGRCVSCVVQRLEFNLEENDTLRCEKAVLEAQVAGLVESLAWVTEDTVDGQTVNGKPRRIWWENNEGVGIPIYTAPQPTEPDEERLAMEAVMESVDPATWPGLTTAQRCALGRFAKPQPAEQQPTSDVSALVEALESAKNLIANHSGEVLSDNYAGDQIEQIDAALAAYRKGEEP